MWHISTYSSWFSRVIGYPQLCHTVSSVLYSDTSRNTQQLHCKRSGESRILCRSGLGIVIANCIYEYVCVQLKLELHHTGTWSAAEWQLPASYVTVPHYPPTTLVWLHFHLCNVKFGVSSEMLLLFFLIFKNFVSVYCVIQRVYVVWTNDSIVKQVTGKLTVSEGILNNNKPCVSG
jgi:hypothetical protein